jgi:hypothetical protein
MGFFSRRKERESAIPDSANEQALGSFAKSEGQPVIGQQVAGGTPQFDLQNMGAMEGLQALMQLGPMIQQAMASGNVQISQGDPQVLDMRGSELGAEIRQIMANHGIDPDSQTASNVDASAYGDMQQQILQALANHGIDPNASGSSINFQISTDSDGDGKPG